jgi:hypothetical protein
MRHHEADFRVTESEVARQQFAAYKSFTDIIRPINATPEMKASLEQVVKTYAETFGKWVEGYDKVRPLHAVIDIDSQNMLPRADDIIAYARKTAENAGQQLTKSQSRTRNGIINVGIAMAALGPASAGDSRSITRPLNGPARVMTRLADGDTMARIPATSARRDRRHGAHRHRIPRQHESGNGWRTQSEAGRARATQRGGSRRRFLAVQASRRKRARQASRRVDEAGNELVRSQ